MAFVKPKFIGAEGVIKAFYNEETNKAVLEFRDVPLNQAAYLVGAMVEWNHPKKNNKKIYGKVVRLHGKKGLVMAYFRKGLPGQALATTVKIVR